MKETKQQESKLSSSQWLPHDLDCLSDKAFNLLVSKYKSDGYAVFWRLAEILHSEDNNGHKIDRSDEITLESISELFAIDRSKVEEIIAYTIKLKLFKVDRDNNLYSTRVLRNIERREEIVSKRKAAGKLGGLAKAKAKQEPSNSLPNAKQKDTKSLALGKQSLAIRGEESLSYGERLDSLNLPVLTEFVNAPAEGLLALVSALTPSTQVLTAAKESIESLKDTDLEIVASDFKNFGAIDLLKGCGIKTDNDLIDMILNYQQT
jgi:hypothetical protein